MISDGFSVEFVAARAGGKLGGDQMERFSLTLLSMTQA